MPFERIIIYNRCSQTWHTWISKKMARFFFFFFFCCTITQYTRFLFIPFSSTHMYTYIYIFFFLFHFKRSKRHCENHFFRRVRIYPSARIDRKRKLSRKMGGKKKNRRKKKYKNGTSASRDRVKRLVTSSDSSHPFPAILSSVKFRSFPRRVRINRLFVYRIVL